MLVYNGRTFRVSIELLLDTYSVQIQRKTMDSHMESWMKWHMELLLNQSIKTNVELQETTQRLRSTEEELYNTKLKLAEAVDRLSELTYTLNVQNHSAVDDNQRINTLEEDVITAHNIAVDAKKQYKKDFAEIKESIELLGTCTTLNEEGKVSIETRLMSLKYEEKQYEKFLGKRKEEINLEDFTTESSDQESKNLPVMETQLRQYCVKLKEGVYTQGIPRSFVERYATVMKAMAKHEVYRVGNKIYIKLEAQVGMDMIVDIIGNSKQNHPPIAVEYVEISVSLPRNTQSVCIYLQDWSVISTTFFIQCSTNSNGRLKGERKKQHGRDVIRFKLPENCIHDGCLLMKMSTKQIKETCKTQ